MKTIELLSAYIDAAMTSDEEVLNRIHFMLMHDIRMRKARKGRLRRELSSTDLNKRFDSAHGKNLISFKTILKDER